MLLGLLIWSHFAHWNWALDLPVLLTTLLLAVLLVLSTSLLSLEGRQPEPSSQPEAPQSYPGGSECLQAEEPLPTCSYTLLLLLRALTVSMALLYLAVIIWVHLASYDYRLDLAVTFSAFAVLGTLGLASAAYSRRCLLRVEKMRQRFIAAYAVEMEQQASIDPLTGLHNRRYFFTRLEEEMKRAIAASSPLALLLVDVDGLKAINDRFGHQAGDEALVSLAKAMRSACRASDIAARLGGDEFAILMPDTDRKAALTVQAKLQRLLSTLPMCRWDGSPPHALSVSVGVASYPEDGSDIHALLQSADAALYRRKGERQRLRSAAP